MRFGSLACIVTLIALGGCSQNKHYLYYMPLKSNDLIQRRGVYKPGDDTFLIERGKAYVLVAVVNEQTRASAPEIEAHWPITRGLIAAMKKNNPELKPYWPDPHSKYGGVPWLPEEEEELWWDDAKKLRSHFRNSRDP
ncbi:MAG: hypothetical protein GC159_17790 [Phycisphaera sp.]|nr:hypothetical protein [Phycisphaera sp.]